MPKRSGPSTASTQSDDKKPIPNGVHGDFLVVTNSSVNTATSRNTPTHLNPTNPTPIEAPQMSYQMSLAPHIPILPFLHSRRLGFEGFPTTNIQSLNHNSRSQSVGLAIIGNSSESELQTSALPKESNFEFEDEAHSPQQVHGHTEKSSSVFKYFSVSDFLSKMVSYQRF